MAEQNDPRAELEQRIGEAQRAARIEGIEERISGEDEPLIHFRFSPSFREGAFFGFADEAEGAMRAIWDRAPGEDYADAYLRNRDRARAELEAFRRDRPIHAIASEMGGALALPGFGAGGAVAGGTTAGARIARGAAAGGITGGLVGAGKAQEIEDVPSEAAAGMVMGASVGAAIPAGVEGGRLAVSAMRSLFRPADAAAARIGQAIGRDAMTPQQLANALDEAKRLGRPATAADVGGEAVRRELEVAVQSPGAAAQIAERVLSPRNKSQLARLSRDLVRGTGVKANIMEDVITKTMRIRSNAAKPVYKRAMEFPAELSDDIVNAWEAAVKTPLGKQALGKARKILNVEDFNDAPLMERIDAFKRGLDDVIGASKRKGENAIARKALEVKKDLIGLVDAANPHYKKARAIWEEGSNYLDAIDRGREVLKPSFTTAKLKLEFDQLGDAEQEAFRIGVVDAVVTRLRQNSAKEPNLIKALRAPEIRDKLKAVMKPERAKELDKILDIEDSMFKTASQARFGSPTAQRQAAMAEQEKQLSALRGLDFLLELVITPMRSVFTRALPAIPRATRERLIARQNALIAKRLLSSDPDELLSIPAVTPGPPRITGGAAIPSAVVAEEEARR